MAKFTFNYIFLCLLVFLSIFFSSVNSQDDACIEETPCLCKLSNNRYINISGVVGENQGIKTRSIGNLTFYFSPCENVQFLPPPDVTNLTKNDCNEPTSLCVYNATNRTMTNLGKVQDHTFTGGLPKEIMYNKEPSARVLLSCTLEDITALAPITTTESNYVLALVSPDVCVKHSHGGLSVGSKLLIMFAVILAIYFIGGALVLHFLRGAQGKEMIPNVEFWSSLPGLMKDGFVFLLNGCHPIPVSNAEAYDRI